MNQETTHRLWITFGVGAILLGLALFLVFLGRGPLTSTPMVSPIRLDVDQDQIVAIDQTSEDAAEPYTPGALPDISPISTTVPATVTSVSEPALSPFPVADRVPSEVAVDFTLDRAGGEKFTLSDQLTQGPVILVFFQKCG